MTTIWLSLSPNDLDSKPAEEPLDPNIGSYRLQYTLDATRSAGARLPLDQLRHGTSALQPRAHFLDLRRLFLQCGLEFGNLLALTLEL